MITPIFSSRRAERFAQLLDEAAGARRHHVRSVADGDLTELVAMSQRVSTLPLVVEVDPEFRTGLRASLMARIEREGIGATSTAEPEAPPRRRIADLLPSGRTRGAIIVTLVAGGMAASGVSAASGDAIPGDALYGVKRSTERAQLAFAGSDVSRGQLYYEFAKVRLAEAGALGSEPERLGPALDDMDSDTRQGTRLLTSAAVERGDKAGLQAIQQFAGAQRPIVQNLVNRLTGPAKGRAAESLALIDQITNRASALENTVNCPDVDVPLDELGAVPVFCASNAAGPRSAPGAGSPAAATPQPAAPTATGGPGQPAVSVPSVEAGSPSSASTSQAPARSGDDKADDSDGGVVDSVRDVIEDLLG